MKASSEAENLKWLIQGSEELDAWLKTLGPALLPPNSRELFAMIMLLSERVRQLEAQVASQRAAEVVERNDTT